MVEDRSVDPPRKTRMLARDVCGTGKTVISATGADARASNDGLTDYTKRVRDEEYLRRCVDDVTWITNRFSVKASAWITEASWFRKHRDWGYRLRLSVDLRDSALII
jgi:hypothetical protein